MKRLEGKRILIVEDLPDNRMVLSYILADLGATIDEASDGKEALSKIEGDDYDLVLMDINMPVMSGFDVMQKIKPIAEKPPVIALTAARVMDEKGALTHGFASQILKPVDPYKLIDEIEQFL